MPKKAGLCDALKRVTAAPTTAPSRRGRKAVRIPVKVITDSGGKVISESGAK